MRIASGVCMLTHTLSRARTRAIQSRSQCIATKHSIHPLSICYAALHNEQLANRPKYAILSLS
jgi:hypothetical protein